MRVFQILENSGKNLAFSIGLRPNIPLLREILSVTLLFADTPKGANACTTVYSIVETAKANGFNIYLLRVLLLYMTDTDWRNHPELLDDLMPWSADVQYECKS